MRPLYLDVWLFDRAVNFLETVKDILAELRARRTLRKFSPFLRPVFLSALKDWPGRTVTITEVHQAEEATKREWVRRRTLFK